tara:strand:- start:758 stop:1594 length:837 start_codon:yes stop_codon:yes gene_type:complete
MKPAGRLIDTTSGDYDFTYLSLGAGVQSSALLVLACTDDRVPKPDIAVFADTGDEPAWVYEYLEVLKEFAEPYGVEVVIGKHKSGLKLSEYDGAGGTRAGFVPLFTKNADGSKGMTRRTCTREFKIDPIVKAVRTHLGYKPKQRVKERVRCMLGISLDEIQRMKESWLGWVTNCWPLIDLSIRREDCYKIIEDAGLPEPQRSACVYCPFHSDAYWKLLKDNHPAEFAKAISYDEQMRHTLNNPAYIHRSCVPLKDATFGADPNQVSMFDNECEGMCGV